MKSSSIYFHKNTIMVFSSAHLASLAFFFSFFLQFLQHMPPDYFTYLHYYHKPILCGKLIQ